MLSSADEEGATSFADPVAIGEAPRRRRVVVQGRVTDAGVIYLGGGPGFSCTLEDATGSLRLVFLGRTAHEDIQVGELLVVEGTIGTVAGRSSILNPLIHTVRGT